MRPAAALPTASAIHRASSNSLKCGSPTHASIIRFAGEFVHRLRNRLCGCLGFRPALPPTPIATDQPKPGRAEEEPRTLTFVDMLGFAARTVRHPTRTLDRGPDEHGFLMSGTTPLQAWVVRLQHVLDMLFRAQSLCGGVSAQAGVAAMKRPLTDTLAYDTVIHMEEVLTIRLPKGTRRRLERRAKAQKLSVSQLVRRAIEQDELLTSLASARAELLPQARAQGIYTDEDVFAIVS